MADGRVSAQRVVKSLDIVEHTGPRIVSAAVGLASGPLSLQRGEEALHRRVVPEIACAARQRLCRARKPLQTHQSLDPVQAAVYTIGEQILPDPSRRNPRTQAFMPSTSP